LKEKQHLTHFSETKNGKDQAIPRPHITRAGSAKENDLI